VDDERWAFFNTKRDRIQQETQRLGQAVVHPERIDEGLSLRVFGGALTRDARASELLRRPEVSYEALTTLPAVSRPEWWNSEDERVREQVVLQVEVQAKYTGYIDRQSGEIERHRRHEHTQLPAEIDYATVRGLSNEVRQRLGETRPATLGQASRIPGMTPAAVSLLLVHLKKNGGSGRSTEIAHIAGENGDFAAHG
jgi:tRNA uridine 5-carboxymethylaminomethyl modification enzyme